MSNLSDRLEDDAEFEGVGAHADNPRFDLDAAEAEEATLQAAKEADG